jgi:hypothetical protein
MPELLTPGVFIQEVNFGPQPIEGVSTSTAGFVGETERGQVGQPTLVTSFSDYQRKFGGFLVGKPLPLAVRGFFDNGGKRAFIVRAAAQATSDSSVAAAATINVGAGYQVQLLATPQPGTVAGNSVLRVASVVGVQKGLPLNLIPTNGAGTPIPGTVQSINATAGTLEINVPLASLAAVKPNTFAVQYTTFTSGTPVITFNARDVGTFANGRLKVLLTPIYVANTTIANTTVDPLTFVVTQIAPFAANQTVEVEDGTGARVYATITLVNQSASTITLNSGTGVATGNAIRVTGWRLDTFFDGALVETINNISSANNAPDGSGLPQAVNTSSQWVRVGSTLSVGIGAVGTTSPPGAVNFPLFSTGQAVALTAGADGAISAIDFIGIDQAGNRTGLKALEAQEGVNIIAAPGQTDVNVIGELIGQAERRLDRFAVFESKNEQDITQVLATRGLFNSRFAAMYHPWLQVLDPATGTTIAQPPAGHVIGCYARTDNDRGVFKAPANVVVQGISGFSRVVVDGEQDLLNPAGVNVLRTFEGLGNVIWGARTISAEGLWKYVPVRRLFIFLEQSIVKGTRFAVFEPNDEILWANIHDAVTNFLTTQWRAGALFGATAAQAFFVKVDETTTTQDDRDNGRVNIIVGIAPVKPAEFIVFQIGQAPNSVIIAEQSG